MGGGKKKIKGEKKKQHEVIWEGRGSRIKNGTARETVSKNGMKANIAAERDREGHTEKQ